MYANEALAPRDVTVVAAPPTGRIGPNAVTRMAEALTAHGGSGLTASIFAHAGLARYLATPPEAMVDETEVARLHLTVAARLQRHDGVAVARDAGRRTADYLLARRIPRAAQWLLRQLPRRTAAGIMARAIAGHAWTFAGSGRFNHVFDPADRRTLWLNIIDSPLCRDPEMPAPACDYFAATFEGVFGAILGPTTRVVEIECSASGAPACRFRVRW
ncbi:bacteriochlorophyll 4-vinyl reductase [Polymorphobacter fuscus]|uniref:Bacteriochlorophyll 4-vinyl reductase n=1 Tax=Sandarakinorhabdus fusca TaxID=1439888 RepID=A0A7C9GRM1_9SPHN|nr:bacteriochlorophyll 4-vinyl reductase [Polymorphobacter fuscus]KAB7643728.1 bacteriochlorophyll 4-vinyl reductase [Polymorphobacter fuscus]MQT18673.1 bacteriochlorophyll 4-vinyl reductase [Polymorphobacter fuscus]NJC08110.1 divinyl protochlorophyllide a 8-vinyl-reductase [Polymorphobacter fuscus]